MSAVTTIGVDSHKHTHTMCAVNSGGKKLGEKTVATTTKGNLAALTWARTEYGRELLWAVEDTRAMTHRLERDLINAGETVIRVPPHLMARQRRSNRQWGKSDPLDALATARASQREPGLPIARHHPGSRHVKLLIDRREDVVKYRTAVMQRLLWRCHEIDPENRFKPGELTRSTAQRALDSWLAAQSGLIAELAREELAEIMRATPVITALEKRIMVQVQEVAPSLLELYGCAALNAGRIIGETADVSRFRNEAAFARYAGLAPVPHWSGSTQGRMRSHRGGNRQLNGAIHQIAMIQIKKGGPAEAYYRRRRAERDLHRYALDGVKRRVARTVFNRLRADHREPPYDVIIADLARRADEWAALIPPQHPLTSWPAYVPPLPHPDPIFAQLTQMADDWEAQVASFGGAITRR